MTLFTVGYEGLSLVELMSLLAENDIKTIVDVRQLPLSRKPGFSKKRLGAALNHCGREYVHIPALGCPKPIRERYRQDNDWARYTEGFMQYLATQEDAVAELSSLAATANCVLLCFEADHNCCHRSMVANAVEQQTHAGVQHLQGRVGQRQPAKLVAARIAQFGTKIPKAKGIEKNHLLESERGQAGMARDTFRG